MTLQGKARFYWTASLAVVLAGCAATAVERKQAPPLDVSLQSESAAALEAVIAARESADKAAADLDNLWRTTQVASSNAVIASGTTVNANAELAKLLKTAQEAQAKVKALVDLTDQVKKDLGVNRGLLGTPCVPDPVVVPSDSKAGSNKAGQDRFGKGAASARFAVYQRLSEQRSGLSGQTTLRDVLNCGQALAGYYDYRSGRQQLFLDAGMRTSLVGLLLAAGSKGETRNDWAIMALLPVILGETETYTSTRLLFEIGRSGIDWLQVRYSALQSDNWGELSAATSLNADLVGDGKLCKTLESHRNSVQTWQGADDKVAFLPEAVRLVDACWALVERNETLEQIHSDMEKIKPRIARGLATDLVFLDSQVTMRDRDARTTPGAVVSKLVRSPLLAWDKLFTEGSSVGAFQDLRDPLVVNGLRMSFSGTVMSTLPAGVAPIEPVSRAAIERLGAVRPAPKQGEPAANPTFDAVSTMLVNLSDGRSKLVKQRANSERAARAAACVVELASPVTVVVDYDISTRRTEIRPALGSRVPSNVCDRLPFNVLAETSSGGSPPAAAAPQ